MTSAIGYTSLCEEAGTCGFAAYGPSVRNLSNGADPSALIPRRLHPFLLPAFGMLMAASPSAQPVGSSLNRRAVPTSPDQITYLSGTAPHSQHA